VGKLIRQILNYAASMQFALVILLLIACFMIAGSFISSNIFSNSYLFAFLAGMLFLSLLFCCIRRIIRLPGIIRKADGYRSRIVSIGSPVMHVGILLLLTGMIMGQFTGFNDTATLTAGQSYFKDGTNFELRLESFDIIYDGDYNITAYISKVTVIEDGREILTKDVTVNSPLSYKGVKCYQSTYGWAVKLKITDTATSEVLLDRVIDIPATPSGRGSIEYSMYDAETGTNIYQQFIVIPDQISEGSVNTYSPFPDNPALFFILYYDSDIAVMEDIALGGSEDVSGLTISFEGLEKYSGLDVSSKPELPVIFSGAVVLIIGLAIVFYLRKPV
jgi:cytochrome c biogenesis protein